MESIGNTIFGIFFMLLPLLLLMWIYNEAEENGHGGCLWVLLVVFFGWAALAVYLIFFRGLAAPQRRAGPKRSEDLQYRSMYSKTPTSANQQYPDKWGETTKMKSSISGDVDFADETLDRLIRDGKLPEARLYVRDMVDMAKEMGDRQGLVNYKQYEGRISKASASKGFSKTSSPIDPY